MPSFSLALKNCTFFFSFIIRLFLSYSVLVHCNCLPDRVIVWYHQFFLVYILDVEPPTIVQPHHSRLSSEFRRDWCYSQSGGAAKIYIYIYLLPPSSPNERTLNQNKTKWKKYLHKKKKTKRDHWLYDFKFLDMYFGGPWWRPFLYFLNVLHICDNM